MPDAQQQTSKADLQGLQLGSDSSNRADRSWRAEPGSPCVGHQADLGQAHKAAYYIDGCAGCQGTSLYHRQCNVCAKTNALQPYITYTAGPVPRGMTILCLLWAASAGILWHIAAVVILQPASIKLSARARPAALLNMHH